MASIPAAVTRLLSARYPTLQLDPNWLSDCIAYLRAEQPGLTDDTLAKTVRTQLLSADLAAAAKAPAFPPGIQSAEEAKIGDGPRRAVLLQIVSIMDIGVSAANQLDVAEARKAARSTLGGEALLQTQAVEIQASREDHMADFEAQEEEAGKSATVFSRRTLRLELSDGWSPFNVHAFEHERVPSLDMNTTPLGCKVLLKGAVVRKGQIFLNPQCCQVEGGRVEELDSQAEDRLIDALRQRLGKPPLEPTTRPAGQQTAQRPVPPAAASATLARPQQVLDVDEFDVYDDADFFEEAARIEAESAQLSRSRDAPIPRDEDVIVLDDDDDSDVEQPSSSGPRLSNRDDPIVIESSPEP